ncbi:hypothetical protein [Amycolatopsis sp. NPDC051102]|uniref:hypothetical protein n=1 Tax=Amycolatopsis sp. NPDC051102 TaxID=3155163 RepID=UPI0034368F3C
MRTVVLVLLVVDLVACGQPVTEVKGTAVPVPVRTSAPAGALLGDTPVASGTPLPEAVQTISASASRSVVVGG